MAESGALKSSGPRSVTLRVEPQHDHVHLLSRVVGGSSCRNIDPSFRIEGEVGREYIDAVCTAVTRLPEPVALLIKLGAREPDPRDVPIQIADLIPVSLAIDLYLVNAERLRGVTLAHC